MNELKYIEHHTFAVDKETAAESIAMDFMVKLEEFQSSSIKFLNPLKITVDDAIKAATLKIKSTTDIYAIRVLKPTHPLAVKAHSLHDKHSKEVTLLELALLKANEHKQALLDKFSSQEYKESLDQTRMTCKSCSSLINVRAANNCNCPVCGKEAALVTTRGTTILQTVNRKISTINANFKKLNDDYNFSSAQLIANTHPTDYHWFGVSVEQIKNVALCS